MQREIKLPPDADRTTKQLYDLICCSTAYVYRRIPDPKDKFIVAFVFEMGYSQYEAAIALGLAESNVSDRLKKVRHILKAPHPEEIGSH